MNLSGGLRRLRTVLYGPRPAFIFAHGQEGNQPQQPVAGGNQPVQSALSDPHFFQELRLLLRAHLGNVFLNGGRDGDHLRLLALGDLPDRFQEGNFALVLSDVVFGNVRCINHRFGRQQEPSVQDFFFFIVRVIGSGRFAAFKVCVDLSGQFHFGAGFFVPAPEILFSLFLAPLHRLHVRKDQFQVDGLDIPPRIHRSVHVDDVLIFKAPNDVNNRVHFPDMAQEFVPQAFTPARALHQSCNIHKFNRGRRHLLRVIHLRQHVQPSVRYHHDACIRLNGAEGIVLRLCAGVCDCVKQRAFPDIGQSDNTEFHISPFSPSVCTKIADKLGNSLYRRDSVASSFPNRLSCDKITGMVFLGRYCV